MSIDNVAVQVHDEADDNISLPSNSFSAGQIIFLVLISPLILVILILLGLVWLVTLPFAPDKHDMSTNPSDPNTDSANPNGAYFQSKRSNLWLFYRSWWPAQVDAVPRGVVFFSHGFGEHISRVGYKELANLLTDRGFVVFALDHQGHGKSGGTRAYFADVNHVVDDLHQFANSMSDLVQAKHPQAQIPRILIGHSMGGLVSLLSALRSAPKAPQLPRSYADDPEIPECKQVKWDALVVSAPAIVVDPEIATPTLKALAKLLGTLLPKLALDALPPSYLSRNQQAIQTYVDDAEIWHSGARARVARELISSGQFVCENANCLQLPMLIVHGGADKIVPLLASRILNNRAGSQDRKILIFPEAFHEIFEDDADKQEFMREIVSFADRFGSK